MVWLSTGSKAQLFSMRRRIMYLYNENSVVFRCWLCSYHHQICLRSWQAADFIWVSNCDYTWQWWIPQGFLGLRLWGWLLFFSCLGLGIEKAGGGIFSVTVQWGLKGSFLILVALIMHRDESSPWTSSSLYWQSCPSCDETQEQFLLSVLSEMEQNMFTEPEHTIALRGASTTLCSKGDPQSTKTSARSVEKQPHNHVNIHERGIFRSLGNFLSSLLFLKRQNHFLLLTAHTGVMHFAAPFTVQPEETWSYPLEMRQSSYKA